MSGTVSTRWFWSDWLSDPGIRACSYAARGLWIDMLCLAASNKESDYGFLTLNGKEITPNALARMTNGGMDCDIESLLAELEQNGVFSRDRRGFIYCRRLVRTQKNRENGRLGGNPKLLKQQAKQKPDNRRPKPLNPLPFPLPESVVKKDSRASIDPAAFDSFWKAYPKRRGGNPSKPARAAFEKHLISGVQAADLILAARNYAAECRRDKKDGTQYVAQAVTWLNQSRFLDYQKEGINGHDEADRSSGLVEAGRRLIAKLNGGDAGGAGQGEREPGEAGGQPRHRDVRLLS